MPLNQSVERIICRFESRGALTEADRVAFRNLPFMPRTLDPATYIVREGEPPTMCALLLSGFAYRHKVTGSGERQILAVQMPGDFLDLQNSFLKVADHNVQALTRCEVAFIPVQALRVLADAHPALGIAMWVDTLIDASVFREWMVNVGRRDSLSRIAHLLCEFALRLNVAGLSRDYRYELPMTQEQIADAAGLTPVHVNRVLKELGRQGLIERDKRAVTIIAWDRLRQIGDFNARYLHFGNGAASPPEHRTAQLSDWSENSPA